MKIVRFVLLVAIGLYLLVVAFLFFAQESFLFQPSGLDSDYQFNFKHEFEELNLTMSDGAVINALHFKTDSAKGVILYFHGNAGNLNRWGEIVQYHVGLGYDVIIMDYRKYGKSKGDWSYDGFLSDAEELYQYAMSIYPEDKIVVYGRSLGTGFASWVASTNRPKMLILESPYTSIGDMAEFFYPLAPARYLIRYNFKPSEYLKQLSCPLFIIHGTDDLIVPYFFGEQLYDQLKDQKPVSLVTIEGGSHNDLIEYDSYKEGIESILF